MNSILKKSSLLLAVVLTGGKLLAQAPDTAQTTADYVKPFSKDDSYRTWSIGIHGGALSTYSILTTNNHLDFKSPKVQLGYGGYVKKQITPAVGIQADFLAGKLTGNNSQLTPGGNTYDGFSTKLDYAVSLGANITVGNISWHDNKSAIQPYVTAGGGILGYKPTLISGGVATDYKKDDNGMVNEFFVPIGVGLKLNVAKGINIDFGYQINFVYSDNIDGYKYGANNDKFSYAHAGLEFAIGKKSRPQMAVHNPVSSMRAEYMMENQNTKAQLQSQIDAQKAQNDKLAADLAATNATLAKFTMDSDNDGVADFYDKCPNTPAGVKVDGAGCPLPVVKPEVKVYVTEEDRQVVREAVRNLEFDFGKSTIRQHSDQSLDKLAQLMVAKKFNLKLSGYTDNVGSVDANLKLSRARAEAVKTYLATQGVDPAKITADGFGKSSPIASNKTAKGRQQNRRVEFSLY